MTYIGLYQYPKNSLDEPSHQQLFLDPCIYNYEERQDHSIATNFMIRGEAECIREIFHPAVVARIEDWDPNSVDAGPKNLD